MVGLSAQEVLQVWERGQSGRTPGRMATLLAFACPENTEEWVTWPIGQRDARLLELREKTFGPMLRAFALCPGCSGRLEFELSIPDILARSPPVPLDTAFELNCEDYSVRFRLPDSRDVAEAASFGDSGEARLALLNRCVLEACCNGGVVAAADLPTEVVSRLSERISECDPQAEILLDLACPDCGECWQELLDIASFFWKESQAEARRLLGQVHTLARVYGWGETEILSMSARRRDFYLEMVGA